MTRRIRSATAIRFDVDVHQALVTAAEERDVSVNFLVNKACREFLEHLVPAHEVRWTEWP